MNPKPLSHEKKTTYFSLCCYSTNNFFIDVFISGCEIRK